MPWVRLDDAYYDHRKLMEAGAMAELLWVRGLAWSNRNLSDGFIPRVQARRLGDFSADVAEVNHEVKNDDPVRKDCIVTTAMDLAHRLCEVGCWKEVEGGFQIHDYDKYQRTAEEIRRESELKSEAGRKGAKKRWDGKKKANGKAPHMAGATAPPMAPAIADQWQNDAPTPTPDASNEASPPTPPSTALALVRDHPSATPTGVEPVRQVFDAWVVSTGRTGRTHLDPKRRKKIQAALRDYPIEDVLDAVRGWEYSPHHRGENDRHTVYNDLELLLRDASQIERFRDLARGSTNGPRPRPKSHTLLEQRIAARREARA
jgi:hypothetical protein